MRLPVLLLSALPVSLAIALAAPDARAQAEPAESEYPLSFVERPLTLSRLTLAPELEFEVARNPDGAGVTPVGINLGATFGITRNIEVGAFFLPLTFTPKFSYGNPVEPESNLQVFSTFRFLNVRAFEMGARLRAYFITTGGAGAQIVPSIPLLIHLGRVGRIDAEVEVPITVRGSSTSNGTVVASGTVAGLNVPISIAFDIIEPLHVGLSTGVQVEDFSAAKDTLVVPLGFFAGFAIGGKRPYLDIDGFFQWGQFIAPAAADNSTTGPGLGKINAGDFNTGLAVKGYFYFF